MLERIKKHLENRDEIIVALDKIMGYCDDSPIILSLDCDWVWGNGYLHTQVEDEPLEDNYYEYKMSSLGDKDEEYFIGSEDGITYIMVNDGDWENSNIIVLDNNNYKDIAID